MYGQSSRKKKKRCTQGMSEDGTTVITNNDAFHFPQ
jgi:hypothetical protein